MAQAAPANLGQRVGRGSGSGHASGSSRYSLVPTNIAETNAHGFGNSDPKNHSETGVRAWPFMGDEFDPVGQYDMTGNNDSHLIQSFRLPQLFPRGRPPTADSSSASNPGAGVEPLEKTTPDSIDKRRGCCGRNPLSNGSWTYEMLSMALSLGSIAAIVAVLATMNGRALSDWTMPIQPNALISILSVITKASLTYSVTQCVSQLKWLFVGRQTRSMMDFQRFDDASRGTWGSLMFLWRFRLSALTASAACLITVVALAIGPFTQQILDFPFRLVPSEAGSAYTLKTQSYTSGLQYGGTPQQANSAMQGAMVTGILGQLSGPPFVCPTGNCTYPEVATLGIGSSCEDVTAASTVSCPNVTTKLNQNTNCTVTTPSGDVLTVRHGIHGGSITNVTWGTLLTSTARQYPVGYQPPPTILFEFSLWNTSGAPGDTNGSSVYECTIELAERTYSSFNVTRGEQTTPSVTTTNQLAAVPHDPGTDGFLRFRLNSTATAESESGSSAPGSGSDSSANYSMGVEDMASIGATLLSIFVTSLYPTTAGISQAGEPGVPLTGLDFSNVLYSSRNLSALVGGMALQMTEHMRSSNVNATGAAAVVAVPGEAFQQETYIRVHWPWFVLPAGLVLCAVVVLLATVAINRARGFRVWKSSALPMLLLPLDGAEQLRAGLGEEELSAVEKQVRGVDLRLGVGRDGELSFLVS